jgi:parvulin-like peptidyl-prolyl cis-trans isomerase-like protein
VLSRGRREKQKGTSTGLRGALGAAIVAVAGLAACGGSGHGPAVVHIGNVTIDRSTARHWTRIVQRGGAPGDSAEANGTPRERALDFLISARWLIGEAKREGAPISAGAVDRGLVERREQGGPVEFEQELHAAGMSIADAKLEVRAGLAAAAIRRNLKLRAAAISNAEVVSFYQHNPQPFRHHEVRTVELIENLPSARAAEALVRRIGIGRAFSRRAYHEAIAENTDKSRGTAKTPIGRAIFAARPNVVSRPMPLNHAWTVFIVRRIEPATIKPLSQVRGEVLVKLTALRLQRIAASFTTAYETRWKAETSCRPGYVVWRCKQYRGKPTAQGEPFLSS